MSVDATGVHKKIYDLLIAANICSGRVYDVPPQGTLSYPYVELATDMDIEDDDSTGDGLECHMQINAWSEYAGQKEVNDIKVAIRAALHHQAFTTSGGTNCLCWIDQTQNLKADDGVGWQGVIRLRVEART